MWWFFAALAGPVNGDFEDGLNGWVQHQDTTMVVEEGTSFSGFTDTTPLVFPSNTHALLLRGAGGTSPFDAALLVSDVFLVTHQSYQVYSYAETHEPVTQFNAVDGAGHPLASLLLPTAVEWVHSELNLAPSCGASAALLLVQTTNENRFSLIDNITGLQPCAEYIDQDMDGACPFGVDLDHDGDCTGPDEAIPVVDGVVDCDDHDASRSSGTPEVLNDGVDQDCDGFDRVDSCFSDADGDGYGVDPAEGPAGCIGPGIAPDDGDCDDLNANINPAAHELCDGVDTNCDGISDTPSTPAWFDADGDGYGDHPVPGGICGPLGALADQGGDCDDLLPEVHPSAVEIPADGLDQDCNGMETCYADDDLDGFAGSSTTESIFLDCRDHFNLITDCDDTRGQVNPGAPELCDNLDNNCDSVVDEGLPAFHYYLDVDGDGYGGTSTVACIQPGPEWVQAAGDCDESDPSIFPGALDGVADGIDQDCDGGDRCYRDNDGDGFGTPDTVSSPDLSCEEPGEANNDQDCDDRQAAAFPGATEVPGNGIDEDCDGVDGAPGDTGLGVTYLLRGGSSCSTSFPTAFWVLLLPALLRRR